MRIKCNKCNRLVSPSAAFCPGCGAKLTAPAASASKTSDTKRPSKAGAAIAIVLSVLVIAVILLPVLLTMILQGADFGLYGFDDIVFEFLKSFGNRLSEYQRTVRAIRRTVMLCQLLLIPIAAGLFISNKRKTEAKQDSPILLSLCASLFTHFGLLASLFLLCLYSYGGFTRTFTFIVFFLSCVLCLGSDILISRKMGGSAIFVMLTGLLLAALITSIYVPLLGVCVVTFGDLCFLFGIALLMAGSAGGGVITVYVI